jgi:hypothetical protein
MKTVSRFEANLLRILACFLRRAPVEQALPLILRPCERPPCLSRAAVELVEDALRKGCLWLLAKEGGWCRERYLRGEQILSGRLWERWPPEELGLNFSRHTMEFLLRMTAGEPRKQLHWLPPAGELTVGDRLLLFFAYDALHGTDVTKKLRTQRPFVEHGLCRLAFPGEFADHDATNGPDLEVWTRGQGAFVLEALQRPLADRWVQLGRDKGQFRDWQHMRDQGRAEERILGQFLNAVETANRRDLARFLLMAAEQLLPAQAAPDAWIGALNVEPLRLAERTEAYRLALVLPRQLERLQRWEREARAVGYLDEGYVASQLWKADWEHWQGETLSSRAQALSRLLEPLKS